MDYENCVSYLNQKGSSYEETDYIYGCDLCQNVCPFNERAPKDLHDEFSFPKALCYPDPRELVNMDDDEFKKLYGNSALAWRGASTIRKNAKRYLKRNDKLFFHFYKQFLKLNKHPLKVEINNKNQ